MKNSTRTAVLSILLVSALTLSACSYFAPQATPTIDQQSIQNTLNAMVTQTVRQIGIEQTATAMSLPVQPTETAIVLPTLTETMTQAPTAIPSATATIVLATPTKTRIPATRVPSATPTPNDYSCSVVSKSPADGAKIVIGTDFDAKWVIQNNGSRTWDLGYVDLVYDSGSKMQTYSDVFDVTSVVKPGEKFTFLVDMRAPSPTGAYKATWKVMMENITMCTITININSVNP